MAQEGQLPGSFLREIKALEASYLKDDDPIRQSGFGGGSERWRAEREPILDAVEGSGDFLDVGCANGYLLECLVKWGRERGLKITPYGVDIGTRLIDLAKQRLPRYASNFYVANAWDWDPPREFQYVYTLYDCVPPGFLKKYVRRLISRAVCRGGRLILGAYGSRSRGIRAFDAGSFLESMGVRVAGTAEGGSPAVSRFAWTEK
jgi:SAM-dependent methyltransferase